MTHRGLRPRTKRVTFVVSLFCKETSLLMNVAAAFTMSSQVDGPMVAHLSVTKKWGSVQTCQGSAFYCIAIESYLFEFGW